MSTGKTYRMAGELVPESGMKEWHNSRGIPWGSPFSGPEPMTVSRMEFPVNLTVHLANEHGSYTGPDAHQRVWAHMNAHVLGMFRRGQEHYHAEVGAATGKRR